MKRLFVIILFLMAGVSKLDAGCNYQHPAEGFQDERPLIFIILSMVLLIISFWYAKIKKPVVGDKPMTDKCDSEK